MNDLDLAKGNIIIVAAPSGAGKTSLVKTLKELIDKITISISHTTRPKRPKEEHGKDYFFITKQEFVCMIQQNAFLEYATVFDHYYGTSYTQIKTCLEAGIDVVLDIDWQGAKQIKRIFPDSISVFIIPPSLKVLRQRLFNRGQDHEEIVFSRMKKAQDELSHYTEFDYLIVNDDFDRAVFELQAIVMARRLCINRQKLQQKRLLSFLLEPNG